MQTGYVFLAACPNDLGTDTVIFRKVFNLVEKILSVFICEKLVIVAKRRINTAIFFIENK